MEKYSIENFYVGELYLSNTINSPFFQQSWMKMKKINMI